MEITINHKNFTLGDAAGLREALQAVQVTDTNGVAIAVNNQVVPRADWPGYVLQPGDKITLIRATQGG